jgi:hypothetical protein
MDKTSLVDVGEVTLFVRRLGRRDPERPTLVVSAR